MRGRIPSSLLASTLLLGSLSAKATLVPELDLSALIENSDAVIVGRAMNVRQIRRANTTVQGRIVEALSMRAELDVQNVLKGKVAGSSTVIEFFLPTTLSSGYRGITLGQFGVFFLCGGPTSWTLTDPYHPYVVAAPGAPVTSGSSLDKVTSEVADAISSPEASAQTKREAVESLSNLMTAEATRALEEAARSKEAIPRALAIAALLGRGKTEWIEPAARILLSPGHGLDPYAVWRLSGAIELIELRLKDAKPIPILARLLRVSDVTVRRAGAAALRETRDAAAIGPLIEALRDSDRDVQYHALMGLAEINGVTGEWAPGSELFNQDPERYAKHWREWAKSQNSPPATERKLEK